MTPQVAKIHMQAERIAKKYECSDVKVRTNHIQMTRKDGFVIFLDRISPNDPDKKPLLKLNKLRLMGDVEQIMLAVGIVRGMQISRNYANRSHSFSTHNLSTIIEAVWNNALKRAESFKSKKRKELFK